MAQRQGEFLERGARVFGLSADSPGQNSAVMEKLALPFPILSDGERDQAVTPLGFADERDPRQISRPGVVIISPDGEIVSRFVGKDYADRPDEDGARKYLESPDAQALLSRICDGHSIDWDGHNMIGSLSEDAKQAFLTLQDDLDHLEASDWCIWDMEDWLNLAEFDVTEHNLDTLTQELTAQAEEEQVILSGDVRAYLMELLNVRS